LENTEPEGYNELTQQSNGIPNIPDGAVGAASFVILDKAKAQALLKLPTDTSNPSEIKNGIITNIQVQKWKFNIWIKEVWTVYHP
jgi:hypothetical protein